MQRLFKALIYSLIAYAVCGCAAFDDAYRRDAQPPVPSRAETQSPSKNPAASGVCVLDPVAAAARETASSTPSTSNAPIVEVPEPTYTFGTGANRDFSHTFTIKNVGTSELNIKKFIPG